MHSGARHIQLQVHISAHLYLADWRNLCPTPGPVEYPTPYHANSSFYSRPLPFHLSGVHVLLLGVMCGGDLIARRV